MLLFRCPCAPDGAAGELPWRFPDLSGCLLWAAVLWAPTGNVPAPAALTSVTSFRTGRTAAGAFTMCLEKLLCSEMLP